MNEALRDWVTNVARHLSICIGTVGGPAPLSDDGARLPGGDRRGSARADAGGRGPAARCAGRLRRRRLQRHRASSIPSSTSRRSRSTASRPAGHGIATGRQRRRSRAGGPACCTATAPICCRMRTARSPRRIRFRPGSTIRASGPSTPGCTRPERVDLSLRHRRGGARRRSSSARGSRASSRRSNRPHALAQRDRSSRRRCRKRPDHRASTCRAAATRTCAQRRRACSGSADR